LWVLSVELALLFFHVHGSVYLGNVCVRLKVQLDYMYSLFLYIFSLYVSGAICTHPEEHKLQSTALRVCNLWKTEVVNIYL
jgi:hypothetical protein